MNKLLNCYIVAFRERVCELLKIIAALILTFSQREKRLRITLSFWERARVRAQFQSGYVALASVLIISAVVGITIMSVTFSSIGEAQSGLALYKGEENLAAVEGCVEDLLSRIRTSSTFNLTTITTPNVTCTITYNPGGIDPGGDGPTDWDITVTSQGTNYMRKIRVIFVRSATNITLTSWHEI